MAVAPRGVSIATLSGAVALFGLGMAALRFSTPVWTNLASAVLAACLLSAIVGSIYLRGSDRQYAVGSAIFGWIMLFLIDGSWLVGNFSHDLTSGFVDFAESAVPQVPGAVPAADRTDLLAERSVKVGTFAQILRAFFVLTFSIAGGIVACTFASRADGAATRVSRRDSTND